MKNKFKNIPKKHISYFCAMFLICFLISCNTSNSQKIDFEYVILDNKYYSDKPSSLTIKELIFIENIISNKVEETIEFHEYQSKKKSNFVRQYSTYIDSNGNKIVWINFICDSNKEILKDWKKHIMNVIDGGSCFFNLKVNLDTTEIFDYRLNSVA